ncbi:MAG: response regulator transcription factor [Gemmatimonadaceae bacterium]|nr:response regulator transcription factor [Gemmatimonadaceae bacterium]
MPPAELGASPDAPRTFLVIEDERKIRDIVRAALAEPTDRWLDASTGAQGIALARAEQPTLIVLDLGLPDLDGLVVCRRLRECTTAPIVVLSARHAEAEKVALLDAGADDYVTKPFGPDELRARVRAQLRRARRPAETHSEQVLTLGDVTIDLRRRAATRAGRVLHLTPTEWSLLIALAAHPGRTFTHEQLFHAVWGKEFGQPQQYLRVYITHLRKKIEAEPFAPRFIVTEPGVGYRFVVDH